MEGYDCSKFVLDRADRGPSVPSEWTRVRSGMVRTAREAGRAGPGAQPSDSPPARVKDCGPVLFLPRHLVAGISPSIGQELCFAKSANFQITGCVAEAPAPPQPAERHLRSSRGYQCGGHRLADSPPL